MATTDRFATGARVGDYVIERDTCDGYEATHVLLPRRVRLSVMHPTFAGLRPVAVRMMREACILEALRHPGVPRIYEVGTLRDQRTQQPWVASELVDGESLLGAHLAPVEVAAMLHQVADVLAYAHARNVAHRGVRPDAIVRGDGSRGYPLCVGNWGDARVPDASEDADRLFADDVFALALIADLALSSRTSAPPKLLALIDDMLAPNPMSRPSAAEVVTRAKLVTSSPLTDDDVIEENIELVELAVSRAPTPPPMPRQRIRWTPALGVTQSPAPAKPGVAIGVLERS